MKYWEIIADNISKAGLSWGCVTAVDSRERTIWIADAHRGDGNAGGGDRGKRWKRFHKTKSTHRDGQRWAAATG
jgi:hypothetical protein